MNIKMNMIYWKSDKFWLGRLIEHPDIMTQGETIKELEENLTFMKKASITPENERSYWGDRGARSIKSLAIQS